MRVISPATMLETQRLVKSESELEVLRKSGAISAAAMCDVMRETKPGMVEDQLAARFAWRCRDAGAIRLAYPCVVASGFNANTLHYLSNDQTIGDNELVLMDAGGEYHGYASDITRTFPSNGKFTPAQVCVYGTSIFPTVNSPTIHH